MADGPLLTYLKNRLGKELGISPEELTTVFIHKWRQERGMSQPCGGENETRSSLSAANSIPGEVATGR